MQQFLTLQQLQGMQAFQSPNIFFYIIIPLPCQEPPWNFLWLIHELTSWPIEQVVELILVDKMDKLGFEW